MSEEQITHGNWNKNIPEDFDIHYILLLQLNIFGRGEEPYIVVDDKVYGMVPTCKTTGIVVAMQREFVLLVMPMQNLSKNNADKFKSIKYGNDKLAGLCV